MATKVRNGKVTVEKTDNLVKAQAETMREYGRQFESGQVAKIDAMKYFAKQVNEKLVTLPAPEHADYSSKLLDAAKIFHTNFYAGQCEKTSTLPSLAAESLKTYASQYTLFATPKVYANMTAIESAVAAYCKNPDGSSKTKKDDGMNGKDYSAIVREIASAVRKNKIDPTSITAEKIRAKIAPVKDAEVTETPPTPPAPEVLARNAFITGVKAMIDNGGLDVAAIKSLRNIAKKLGITLE